MGRRSSKERVQDKLFTTTKNNLSERMVNRRQLLAPFPLDKEEVFVELLASEIREAVMLLDERTDNEYMERSAIFVLHVTQGSSIVVPRGTKKDWPIEWNSSRALQLNALPGSMQAPLLEWMAVWKARDQIRS